MEIDASLGKEFDEVSKGGSALETVYSTDVVVGMTSMLLFEAALLGKQTLAILPRISEKKWLPADADGIIPCVFTRDDVRKKLLETTKRKPKELMKPKVVDQNSGERIVNFLSKQLTANKGS